MGRRRVVVTGIGVVSCFGNDVDEFYESLLLGRSGVRRITSFPCDDYGIDFAAWIDEFDPSPYIDKKQARRVDPFIIYGMVAAKKAMEMSGFSLSENDDKQKYGVLIGSGMGGLETFHEGVIQMKEKKKLSPFFIPVIITNMLGALVAIDLGFMGPNYSISTACATGNFCIISALEHIRRGDADFMICGGSEAAINPVGISGFVANKALSKNREHPQEASRPWDRDRDGFVLGEGAGVLVLESLEHAQKRGATILAEVIGGAINCDAYHMTAPREDGLGVSLCLENALKDSKIDREQVGYINAHGTSTPLGDRSEVIGLNKVFSSCSKNIKMNSTKSLIGHCLGGAGGIEAIVAVQAIRKQKLHPTINLENPMPELGDFDTLSQGCIDHNFDVAISNSFGFGGHNSTVVFSKYVP